MVEQYLHTAGVPWTVIAPAAFMDNYTSGWTLAAATHRPITYQEVPLTYVRTRSADLAAMFEYFTTVGLDVDIAGLRRDYPEVGWHSFADWAAGQEWPTLLAPISANQ
ncbi:hypothetical protein [Streptomyces sp. NPDC007100]|uniref:hypothetical protein n=1 Tax=Streptomyces sp. NPDC007100 TaxID=3155602 RepID=UPI0033C32464